MELPSGREISTNSLVDAALLLADESFYLENSDDGEEEVFDNLRSEFFMLSGTEKRFSDEDAQAVLDAVRPVAEELAGRLADLKDKFKFEAPALIEEEASKYEAAQRTGNQGRNAQ